MTDIDFDELDKAVNSVLGPRAVDKSDDAPRDAAPAAAPAPREPKQEEVKSDDSPKIVLTPRPRQPIASPAAKRSGRFMDMVHPSSDMASEKEAPAAPAPRVKIVPTENAPKPEAPVQESPEPEEKTEAPAATHSSILDAVMAPAPAPSEDDKQEDAPEAATVPDEPLPSMKSEYPDPIDVAGPLSIAEEPPKSDGEAEADVVTAPEVPFLPDAKVEKRPLGGFPADDTPEELELLDKEPQDESQLPPETSLPPALQSDVVAVESDALPEMQAGPGATEEKESEKAEPEAKHEKKEDTSAHHDKPSHSEEGAAQSIPQQYRAEPEVADEAPRPVFDTDQYHQPLIAAHAGKKSHAWVFILLVTALLAIGGTLGYFAFMSGL